MTAAWQPELEEVETAALVPHPRNSRKHSRRQIEKLGDALEQWGMTQPIVVDETGTILIGHARWTAAKDLGWDTVPVVRRTGLSEAQKRALIISDNRLHEVGTGWNKDTLDAELRSLAEAKFDLTLTGFDIGDVTALMAPQAARPEEDDVPEVDDAAAPRSQVGDIWILGQHRVACGDSTDEAHIEALLAGEKPRLMVTDPPYGVNYDPAWRGRKGVYKNPKVRVALGKIINDDRAAWQEAWSLFPGKTAYIWHSDRKAQVVAASLLETGFDIAGLVFWLKDKAPVGQISTQYRWQHEPCWVANRGKGAGWRGGNAQTTLWRFGHRRSRSGHSAQKPVEAMRRPMLNHLAESEVAYDPFLGSGTSVIAAETCNRICYGSELDPRYVDVIIRRWQAFTGQEAHHAETGETFGT